VFVKGRAGRGLDERVREEGGAGRGLDERVREEGLTAELGERVREERSVVRSLANALGKRGGSWRGLNEPVREERLVVTGLANAFGKTKPVPPGLTNEFVKA
jgi:hypothetical protein